MLCVLTLVLVAGVSSAHPHAVDLPFHVIVHRSNPVQSLTRAQVSAVFMKRTKSWPDEREIVPADREASARLRAQFSVAIHRKRVAYVIRYWQRLIFSGRAIPPRELSSDAAMIEFVKSHEGAIGYIDRSAAPVDGVKIIAVTP